MKELIYAGTEMSEINGNSYNVSKFLDIYNYNLLFGTDLDVPTDIQKGDKVLCGLDVKYKLSQKKFIFYVTSVSKVK